MAFIFVEFLWNMTVNSAETWYLVCQYKEQESLNTNYMLCCDHSISLSTANLFLLIFTLWRKIKSIFICKYSRINDLLINLKRSMLIKNKCNSKFQWFIHLLRLFSLADANCGDTEIFLQLRYLVQTKQHIYFIYGILSRYYS
jgi:hypothetical protein